MVTCTTCHLNATPAQHATIAADGQAMLRSPASELCRECHTPTQSGRQMHGGGLGRAHLRWPNQLARTETSSSLDEDSRVCLTCHDGSVARDIHAGAAKTRAVGGGDSHPVGVRYPQAAPGAPSPADGTFYPQQSLDSRVRLFGSTVGCGSCHSPYSPHQKLLVMPNVRSQLCLTCHRM
jgi:predicted CXXCH cytochrome family protein